MGNATGSLSPRAETKAFAGVVLFGKSREDLKVIEWACKHLHPSAEYRLCIIHVTELNDTNPPRKHSRYEFDGLEEKINEYYPDCDFEMLQNRILPFKLHIRGIEYKGDNFEGTLQYAINKLQTKGLDTLVLRWSEPDDPQGTPVNRLESNGCSIVLVNVDPSTRNRKVLPLATPPMVVAPSPEGSAAPTPAGAAPAPSAHTPPAPAKEGSACKAEGSAALANNPRPKKTDDAETSFKASTSGHNDGGTDDTQRDEPAVSSNSRKTNIKK